ncbi:MAG: RsmE family RNA methyltransferase, partial [Burkholderiales bacterium]|nr:RsmE family RNA methyltransferase [Burkholderiales bacterium]
KGERQATLLDMATQLGMTAFKPLICERSIVRPRTSAKQRWRRLCIEACKQSRRPYLPLIHDPAPPAEVIDQASAIGYKVWVAHPTGAPLVMGDLPVSIADALLLMVGPEGGFSEHEISQIVAAGAQPVSLGRTILRIETAAIALLAYVTLNAR